MRTREVCNERAGCDQRTPGLCETPIDAVDQIDVLVPYGGSRKEVAADEGI
jgi:hypothetical protein